MRASRPTDPDSRSDLSRRDQLTQLTELFALLRPYRRWLAVAVVGVVVAASLGLVFPRIMGGLVDSALAEDGSTGTLDRIALLLLTVFLIQGVFNYVRIYALAVVGEGVVADLRRSV